MPRWAEAWGDGTGLNLSFPYFLPSAHSFSLIQCLLPAAAQMQQIRYLPTIFYYLLTIIYCIFGLNLLFSCSCKIESGWNLFTGWATTTFCVHPRVLAIKDHRGPEDLTSGCQDTVIKLSSTPDMHLKKNHMCIPHLSFQAIFSRALKQWENENWACYFLFYFIFYSPAMSI